MPVAASQGLLRKEIPRARTSGADLLDVQLQPVWEANDTYVYGGTLTWNAPVTAVWLHTSHADTTRGTFERLELQPDDPPLQHMDRRPADLLVVVVDELHHHADGRRVVGVADDLDGLDHLVAGGVEGAVGQPLGDHRAARLALAPQRAQSRGAGALVAQPLAATGDGLDGCAFRLKEVSCAESLSSLLGRDRSHSVTLSQPVPRRGDTLIYSLEWSCHLRT